MVNRVINSTIGKKFRIICEKNTFMFAILKITQMSHGYQQQTEAHTQFKVASLDIFRKKSYKYTNTLTFKLNPLEIKKNLKL